MPRLPEDPELAPEGGANAEHHENAHSDTVPAYAGTPRMGACE